jgi:hypothetical protein
MPAQDKIHNAVKNALIKDGWTITDDPFIIRFEDVQLLADLGAERSLGAERNERRIVVEIKSFLGASPMREMELALGQYLMYRDFLEKVAPERELYLAVAAEVHKTVFAMKAVQFVVQRHCLKLLVVRVDEEVVEQWIN